MTHDVWEVISAAHLIKDGGGWPNNAGWGNEPAALVDGVAMVWGEMARIKSDLAKSR